MESREDCNKWIYTFKTITRYATILGQVPEWCSWTLANDAVMNFMRRFQTIPDPTEQVLGVGLFTLEFEGMISNQRQEVETRIRGTTQPNTSVARRSCVNFLLGVMTQRTPLTMPRLSTSFLRRCKEYNRDGI